MRKPLISAADIVRPEQVNILGNILDADRARRGQPAVHSLPPAVEDSVVYVNLLTTEQPNIVTNEQADDITNDIPSDDANNLTTSLTSKGASNKPNKQHRTQPSAAADRVRRAEAISLSEDMVNAAVRIPRKFDEYLKDYVVADNRGKGRNKLTKQELVIRAIAAFYINNPVPVREEDDL